MKRNKRWLSLAAALILVFSLLSIGQSVAPEEVKASTISELQQQKEELEKEKAEIDAEISRLEGEMSTTLNSMEDILNQKGLIDQEIFQLHKQKENLNNQIATYNLMIADKQAELEDAERRLEELNAQNKERIRAMEENGNLSYWSVLFKSSSFSELLDSLNMIQEIAAADKRRLEEISAAAEEVAETKEELEVQRGELEETKAELQEAEGRLQKRREEADELLATLVASGAEYERLLEEAEGESAKIGADLDSTNEELEYQQWLSTSKPPQSTPPNVSTGTVVQGLTWITPCNYVLLTSPFGWRTHPIYGDQRFHYGVDLAGPLGTPIVATRAGTVVSTSYDSSSGYYVVIDHGDGFTSKYLHLTHYIVSPGQKVSAGQKIGEMGSTGASTGSHLHFSILYNGNHVDPMLYIR